MTSTFHCDPTSDRWIELDRRGTPVLLSTHPVTRGEYKDYLREIGRPIPPALARIAPLASPVADVSQVDAKAYCEWLTHHQGGEFRLPSVGELLELAQEAEAEGITSEVWPHHPGNRFEVRGGLHDMYLCEWTREVEEGPAALSNPRVLGSIFYPPWLRQDSHTYNAQAHLAATEGFSFVTFRVTCVGRR